MIYFAAIFIGLMISLLLFVQLRNEAEFQNEQVKKIFKNVIIEVRTTDDEEIDSDYVRNDKIIKYPVVSTSITCGKKSTKGGQIDIAVRTRDKGLTNTAAEFFISLKGAAHILCLRRIDQPKIWVLSKDAKKLRCICSKTQEKLIVPDGIRYKGWQGGSIEVVEKAYLQAGDTILMGNTWFEIKHDHGGDEQ